MAIQPALFSKVFGDRELTEAATLAAELGYDGFEPMCREPHLGADRSLETVRELRDHLDDLGLVVPCLATYTGNDAGLTPRERERELETLETFLEFADALNCEIVRHGPGGPAVRDATDEDFERAARWLRRATDRAAEYDVTIAMEIHAGRLSETVSSTKRLLEAIDRDNVGAIHDAGNMYLVDDGFGPESVRWLGDDLIHVHVKDLRRVADGTRPSTFELETNAGTETFQRQPLGEGDVDHGPLFDALAAAGYDGHVTAESTFAPDDARAAAAHEIEELRRLLGS